MLVKCSIIYYIYCLRFYFMKARFMPTAATSAAGVAVVLY